MADDKAITPPKSIAALARIQYDAQHDRRRIFSKTELANIPYTTENIQGAISILKVYNEQTKRMLEYSILQRGMLFCWLKEHHTKHGEWEAFCQQHFPDLNERSIRRWMAAYLVETGQRKPKELPDYDNRDIEDAELKKAIDSLSTDKNDLAPRQALIEHIRKLEGRMKKGEEQLTHEREARELAQAEVEKLTHSKFVPETVRNEVDRELHLRAKFGEFLMFWAANLPTSVDGMRVQSGLHQELCERLDGFWSETIERKGLELIAEAEKKPAKGKKPE